MNKWICVNRECGENCIVESKKFHPANCPMFTENFHLQADWREVTEPVTESNQLPKLTTEVFDRPDCPEWAKWAAVDSDGDANYFESCPKLSLYGPWWSRSIQLGKCKDIAQVFDSTKWQNSLIERPVKETKLPEWCKVGEYGYAYDSGYFKIVEIIDGGRNLKVDWVKEGVQGTVFGCNIKCKKQARLRPYNAYEMRGLVGKVTKDTQGNISFITGYCAHKEVVYSGTTNFTAECLLISCRFLDNAPCGVLEYLEEGEWVE